ncbi:MAG: MarR family transcriptional regulator [Litorimonas sp.]
MAGKSDRDDVLDTLDAPMQPIASVFVEAEPPRAKPPIRPSRLSSTFTLALWKNVTVASVAGDTPDLSARQTAVLMCVYLEEGPHTVRSLASQLNVTKAVISRAIDRLTKHEYILRAPDPRDKRSIVLRRTPNGIQYLRKFAGLIQAEFPKNG